MAATFFGNRTPPSERILRMGAAVTHAAAPAADEIDDGNIFGCAAASAAETELLKGGGKARVETSLECGLPFSHRC